MTILLSSSPNNWTQTWFTTIDSRIIPQPRLSSPIIMTSPIIAAMLTISSGFHSNRPCGYLIQQIRTGLMIGGIPDARTETKTLFEGQLSLFSFDFAGEYSLVFDLFLRVADVGSLSVWEYTGTITQ